MYKLPHFTEADQDVIRAFMESHEFATLIGNNGSVSVATQVPLLMEQRNGKLYLRAHIMRNTDHHAAFLANPNVLVLFTGAHCYVSSGWYSQRRTAATWNYMTVQARGSVQWLSNSETAAMLATLQNKYESGREAPELVEQMPEGYVDRLVGAIAGIEIEVNDVQATFKLSQNNDDASYVTIVNNLARGDDGAKTIAAEMRSRRPNLDYDS